MTTLISFLGKTEANRGYRLAKYRFECGDPIETTFFGVAVLLQQRARHKPAASETPTRWIIIGTPTSGWDQLEKCVAQLAPDSADAAHEWGVSVSEQLATGAPVSPAHLRAFESQFSATLNIEVLLCAVENNADAIFDALHANLASNSRVVLDVTHGLRAMPMHALLALGALRWLGNIEIKDILYGNFEQKHPDGACPAQSLKGSARLARFTPALAQLNLMDDVGHIGGLFEKDNPELCSRLVETQRLESLMQFPKSAVARGQALEQLDFKTDSAIDRTCASAVKAALTRLKFESGAEGLRARAKAALDRGDFMRALAFAKEALVMKVIEVEGLDEKAEEHKKAKNSSNQEFYNFLTKSAQDSLIEFSKRPDAPRHGSKKASDARTALDDARNTVMHARATDRSDFDTADNVRALLNWSFQFFDFMK